MVATPQAADYAARCDALVTRFAGVARRSIYDEYQRFVQRRCAAPTAAGILLHGVSQPYLSDSVSARHSVQLLATAGRVTRHIDGVDVPAHCYFLVLVNDGFVAKTGDVKQSDMPLQPVGTMLYLDTQQEHHLLHDSRLDGGVEPYPGWAALCWAQKEEVEDWQDKLLDVCETWAAAMLAKGQRGG